MQSPLSSGTSLLRWIIYKLTNAQPEVLLTLYKHLIFSFLTMHLCGCGLTSLELAWATLQLGGPFWPLVWVNSLFDGDVNGWTQRAGHLI